MDAITLYENCKADFCGTQEVRMLFSYRSRAERLSFEERQAVIRQVEKSFAPVFPYLKNEAPSLSESDLLYCALASIGLGNTVISECLCISKDSVRMRKYRLREKLSNDWYSTVFPEQKRNTTTCNESVTPNIGTAEEGTITLSQKEYKLLMRKSMKNQISFIDAVKTCHKKVFTIKGRARRSEFWYYFIFTFIAGMVVAILNVAAAGLGVALSENSEPAQVAFFILMGLDFLLAFAIYIPMITSGIRRLHDIERSGNWIWLTVAPTLMMMAVPATIAILDHNSRGQMFASGSPEMIVSMVSFFLFYLIYLAASLVLLLMLIKPGTEGPNKYGMDPIEYSDSKE